LGSSANRWNLVVFELLTVVVMKSTVFWDIMPCSPLKVNQRFRGAYHLHLQGRRISRARNQWQALLVSCVAYSSTLKMEVICFPKTSVDFQWTTWHYIPEDSTLQMELAQKSSKKLLLFKIYYYYYCCCCCCYFYFTIWKVVGSIPDELRIFQLT
jgi:hypothetical protein